MRSSRYLELERRIALAHRHVWHAAQLADACALEGLSHDLTSLARWLEDAQEGLLTGGKKPPKIPGQLQL